MTKKSIDYNDVLSDLRAKREDVTKEGEELDSAIYTIERLAKRVTHTGNKPSNGDSNEEWPKGVYEATAFLLEKNGKPMKNQDIYNGLVKNGIVKEGSPLTNVLTTLYKAKKEKKDCKIALVNPGEWGLSSWSE